MRPAAQYASPRCPLNDILHSGQHLLDIISEILDVAKLQSGTMELRLKPLRPRLIIDDAVRIVRKQAQGAGIALDALVPDNMPMIEGDPVRLRQVLLNLLSNAIKFTPRGGTVSLLLARCLEGIHIEVRDTGIGMAAADIPRALKPFGQVDTSLSRRHGGTGLGLPLCKLFIERHGGSMALHSEPGRGIARAGIAARRGMMRSSCLVAVLLGCLIGPLPGFAQSDASRAASRSSYRAEPVPFPADNPYTPAKERLGRMLFFDPLLSGPATLSCASCHNPGLSWGNGLRHGVNGRGEPLALRVPTLLDVAWSPVLGWDGKFRDLESVAFAVITNPDNMNNTEPELLRRLAAIPGYVQAFAEAVPGEGITRRAVADALATFERTIVAGPAPFDRWVDGQENAIRRPSGASTCSTARRDAPSATRAPASPTGRSRIPARQPATISGGPGCFLPR